ncbi:MAG: hypothetical protein ACC657_11260, partial [Thiohalomonadales bacterium]
NFSKPDPFIQTPSVNDDSFETVITCPIEHLDYCEDPNDRILLNSIIALENALESTQRNNETIQTSNKKCLIYIITPETSHGRGEDLELDEWYDIFTDGDSPLAEYVDLDNIEIKFEQYSDGATEHLAMLCKHLSEGKWDTIIFGGVDSLIDEYTSFEYSQEHRVKTVDNADGIITGEGAAFIILEANNNINTDEKSKPLAYINAISQKEEPNAGQFVCCKYSGQSSAINDIIHTTNLTIDDIDSIIVSSGLEKQFLLEWHQTITTLWPNKLSKQQRLAALLGEIDTPILKPRKLPEKLDLSYTYGFVGAASIPMSIALACARFDFKYPEIKHCMICEANDYAHRGAILLSSSIH